MDQLYYGLMQRLQAFKWLRDAPTHPLQQALQDLERAYKNFFAQRAGFPKFKKRGQHDSFRYPDPKQFKLDQTNGRLFLPKLGWMRLCLSRAVLGAPRNATVSLRAGKWFVSIQTEREVEPPVPQGTSQRCPMCDCVSAANRPTQARFRCVACLHEDNADVVGAKNILARGHRVAACGEAVSRCVSSAVSSKQEPAEATEREATHA